MIRGSLLVLSAFTFVATALPQLAAQPSIELVAEDLAFPTNMAFAPDGRIFFTEKETGDVRIIRDGRVLPEPFVHVSVEASAERGLLGIALHPDFERDPWAYLYYSEAGGSANQIIRVRAEGNTAGEVDPHHAAPRRDRISQRRRHGLRARRQAVRRDRGGARPPSERRIRTTWAARCSVWIRTARCPTITP
jgi:Glucose / Sorbosone dehydrogenase